MRPITTWAGLFPNTGLDRVVLVRVEHVPPTPAAHLATGERRRPLAAPVAAGGGAWDRTERTEEEVSQKKGAGTGGLVGWLGSARACDGLIIDRGQSEEGLGPATCIQRYSSHRAERRTVHGVRSDNRGGRSITLQMALPSRLNSKSYTYTYTYTYTSS